MKRLLFSIFGIAVLIICAGGLFTVTIAEELADDIQVNTYTIGDQGSQAVAIDPGGNFIITWTSMYQDGSSHGIFAQMFDSSGNPVGPEFLVNTYTTNYQRKPAIAVDSNGNFVITWTSGYQDGYSGGGIFAQMFDSSGSPVGSEFQVNSFSRGNQSEPSIAMDSNGNFVIAWGGG